MKRIKQAQDPKRLAPPRGPERVGLESLDPVADDSEVKDEESSDPESDSPGDDALLEQEELYEGISSERMPGEPSGAD